MSASVFGSFLKGFDSLATASNSLLSLYNPTVVIYTFGSDTKELLTNSAFEPLVNEGF